MMRTSQVLVCCAITTVTAAALIAQAPSTPPPASTAAAGDWPTYNRDPGGTRFSPLTDVTPANVATLDVAWTYHMKPAAAPATPAASTPAGHEEQPGAAPASPSSSTSTNQSRGRRGYASSSS